MQLYDLPMKLPGLPPNLYAVHEMVYAKMKDGTGKECRDFLFTILEDLGGMVIIRSADFQEPQRAMALPVEQPENGDIRDFQLVACPMIKAGNGSKPLPINDTPARLRWLARKANQHGFSLIDADVMFHPVHYSRKGTRFWLERATFAGTLKVTDKDKLSSALISGIGRARSLGHGRLWWV